MSDPSLLVLFKTMDKEDMFRYIGKTADVMQKLYLSLNFDPTSVICDASPEFRNIYVYTFNSIKTVFCYTDYNTMCIQFDTSKGESVWNGKIIYTTRAGNYLYSYERKMISDNDIFYQNKYSGTVSKENGLFVDVNDNYIEVVFSQ